MTEAGLGQITRIDQRRLSRIELGQNEPTPEEATRLGRALGLPPDQLLQRFKIVNFDGAIAILPDNGRPLQTPEPEPVR